MSGGEGFSRQAYNPAPDIVMTRCEKAAPLSKEGVRNGEFDVAAITIIGEVWGI